PSNRTLDKSSLSTKASITRTGLSSSIQSSRHSGNSVACPRSVPSTKRFIRFPRSRESLLQESHEAGRFHTARVNSGLQTMSASRPLSPQQRRERGHRGTSHSCHKQTYAGGDGT